MIMNEDEKVIREHIINDSYTSFFVEAGAGAGKTYLIVKRIVKQLENGIKPENIVVITFTNMAAEELRERIAKEVLEKSADNPLMKDVDIDLMQISTIHSFCYRLIKERCFDAKLPLNVKLIEDEQDYQLQDRIFHKYTLGLSKDDWGILDSLGYDRQRDYIARIKKLYIELNRLSSDVQIAIPEAWQSDMESVSEEIEKIRLSFIELVKSCAGKIAGKETLKDEEGNSCQTDAYIISEDFKKDNLNKAGKELYDKACNADYSNKDDKSEIIISQLAFLGSLNSKSLGAFFSKPRGKGKEDLKNIVANCNEEVSGWLDNNKRNVIEKLVNRLNSPKHIILCNYAIKAHEYYIANKPDNVINNNQIIETARDLVKNNEDARRYFASKFTDIYVDEFQDTDHIQEELIWCLGKEGRLFLVGDPKQSIYRFRGAEPAVYFQTKEKMGKRDNTKVCELSYNFRSNPKVIDWVNKQFVQKENMIINGKYIPMEAVKPLLPEDKMYDDSISADGNESENKKKKVSKLISGIYYNKFPGDVSANDAKKYYEKGEMCTYEHGDSDIETDSDEVAKLIYQLVNSDYMITDYTKDNPPVPYKREIKYSDIMVLCRNKNHMDVYLNKMREKGIPVNFAGSYIMNDERAVVTYVRIYRYLSDPWINESKVAAEEMLYANNISKPQDILLPMMEETKDMTAYGIAEYLLNHIGDILNKQTINNNKQTNNNEQTNNDETVIKTEDMTRIMAKLHQLVESVYAECDGDSQQFADVLEKKAECVSERTLSLKASANEVSFMNLHKAKGLEANIVILASRDDYNGFRGGAITSGNKYYPVISGPYEYAKTEWQSYDNDSEECMQASDEELSETCRLEYVAATRAKQAFIIMDRISQYSLFMGRYDYYGKASVKDIINDYKDKSDSNKTSDNIRLTSKKEYTGNRIVTKSLSPSDCESKSKTARECMNIWKKNEESKNELEKERPSGAVLGTMMHRALEIIVSMMGQTEEKVDMETKKFVYKVASIQAVNESLDDIAEPQDADKYGKFIYSVLSSFWDWAHEQGIFENVQNIYTELPFSYMESDADVNSESGMECAADVNSESGMECTADINNESDIDNEIRSEFSWVNGSMDLLIHYKDGSYLLIDYKSDTDYYMSNQQFETALSERYIGQLKMYVKSIKRLYGDSARVNVGIVSFTQKNCKEGVDVRYTKIDM